jgi:hypothetical protein
MKPINWRRVMLGGLLAGVVMNIAEAALHGGVLAQDGADLLKSLNVTYTPNAPDLVALIVMTFILGIAGVWLYAAILPRYGQSSKTAVIAGLAVWVLAHLWSGVYIGAGLTGLVPPKLAYLPIAWGLIEAPVAVWVGALLYKE